MLGNLLGGFQKYLLIAGAAVMGVLVIALKIVSAQKVAARAAAAREKANRKVVEATRKRERAIREAQADARAGAASAEQDLQQRRARGDRSRFGDPRLDDNQREEDP